MAQEELLKDLQRRMDGAIEVLRKEFGGLRTGRASASLLEPIRVTAYGNPVPLNQVASVNVPEPRLITVQVWDRGVVKAVDKAIRESGLGLNPQTEGQTIRVPIPELNQERRRELTRKAAEYAEQARVAVRKVRQHGIEALRKLEKDSEISQDEQRKLQNDIQHLTDDHIKRIDETLSAEGQRDPSGLMSLSAAPPPRLPRHVAIIMDGNGRWAQARGLPRIAGHRQRRRRGAPDAGRGGRTRDSLSDAVRVLVGELEAATG